jgi:hypothetical protein
MYRGQPIYIVHEPSVGPLGIGTTRLTPRTPAQNGTGTLGNRMPPRWVS